MSRRLIVLIIVFLAGAVVAAMLLLPGLRAPRVVERDMADAIYTAIQREADTTFVVTGYMDVVATTRSEDTLILFPALLNLRLGTSRATVRVPGRVSYGFDVEQLTPGMVRVRGDTIELELPLLAIYSTEPDLARLEVETTTGWARMPVTAQEAERRAVQLLNEALQRQGVAHLESSRQPQVNTARALRRMVEPAAVGLGMHDPYFRVYLGEGVFMEP
jgi:hypothetical protein